MTHSFFIVLICYNLSQHLNNIPELNIGYISLMGF